ncbi:unnamed protein product, partial [Discosporangium mesarthrocarpum]
MLTSGHGCSLSLVFLVTSASQCDAFAAAGYIFRGSRTLVKGTRVFPVQSPSRACKPPWSCPVARKGSIPYCGASACEPSPEVGRGATTDGGMGGDVDGSGMRNTGAVKKEAERLMMLPTIDVKLELQMRGIEHRDTFEKTDLVKRLAEARVKAGENGKNTADHASRSSQAESAAWDSSSNRSRSSEAGRPSAPVREEDLCDTTLDEQYERDLGRAKAMGEDMVIRELSAMGIPHSRLSNLSVLSRQYASGRREARQEAGERRRSRDVEELRLRNEATWTEALGRTELIARLRDLGIRFSLLATDAQLARLYVDAGGDQAYARLNEVGANDRAGGWQDYEEGGNDERGGEELSKPIWDRQGWGVEASSGGGREHNDGRREVAEGGGITDQWGEGGESVDWEDSIDSDYSVGRGRRENDGGKNVGVGRLPLSCQARGIHQGMPLRVQASRMTSRELMSTLDSMGVRYPIPCSRSELQRLFTLSCLSQREGDNAGGDDKQGEIVSVGPNGVGEEDLNEYDPQSFQTYEVALAWAQQLTYGDVIDELEFRGVACKPNADYSYLTRLLADAVMVDESMNPDSQGLDNLDDYKSELELAMTMSAQAIAQELESLGARFDRAWSKVELAKLLAEMNLQREGGGWLPISNRYQPGASCRRASDAGFFNDQQESAPTTGWGGGGVQGRTRATSADEEELANPSPWDALGLNIGDSAEGFGDGSDQDDLEALTRSAGSALRALKQETVSLAMGVLAVFFPDSTLDSAGGRGDRRGWPSGASGGRSHAHSSRGTSQDRSGVRRGEGSSTRGEEVSWPEMSDEGEGVVGVSGFLQSSANRAGVAVVRGVVNALVRGAEAAAEWAGGPLFAREHVLVAVASFCLVFKRGVGSSLALLVVIRAGRLTLQRVL